MTRRQRPIPRRTVTTAGLIALCIPLPGLANDYPPPPGPYPSGPLTGPAQEAQAVGTPATADVPPPSSSRRGLLLPAAPDSTDPGMYGASNLFGSAPAVAEPVPARPVFAPTEPAAYPVTDADTEAPPSAMRPGHTSRPTAGQQTGADAAHTYRADPTDMAGQGYQPPAYPAGPAMPPYAAPAMPPQPWHGGPGFDAGTPAETRESSPAGGPVFRPPGAAGR